VTQGQVKTVKFVNEKLHFMFINLLEQKSLKFRTFPKYTI